MRARRVDGVICVASMASADGVVLLVLHQRHRVDSIASMAWPSGPTHRYDKLVEIGDDADALRARFEWRAQQLAAFNLASCERGGYAGVDSGAAFENLDGANKALARSDLGPMRRRPTGTERAENNLEPNYNRERHKADHQEFVNLLTACSNFRPRARGGS